MNKLVRTIAVAATLVVAVASSANAGAVLDRVIATKTLTVAVGTAWGKMSFLNDKHELDGCDVEIAKAIAKYLGVDAKFVTPAWDFITAGKWEGRWDMAMGQMTPTKARAERLSFPAVYFYNRAVAVVHKDSKATMLSDLDGKVVGVAASTTQELYANHNLTPDWLGARPIQYQFKPGQMKPYGNGIQFEDLRLGDGVRLDAVLADESTALNAIQSGYPLRVLDEILYSEPGSIATLPGDKEFDDKIAIAIKNMKDDGTLSKLSIKWYGVDYTVEN
ncbi:transporter substrate-binding domain-containing protein [Mesorhizobium sp.]|uniref:transporter substrate-binding domain-containing protein n=1 Tax=Mesorhizobium sp. TaxID=1871066 RepID=UPI000FE33DEA|nr:transporter substrate-binding domain-containing protein [Mesorhizobium sp.]RWH95506.1 MAG: transporter substrate-binding domain-containing protein [Mesorhizobium sp.]RWK17375.1 MAG: transporter substrate-binding domain-containing protein [Mesorhizobium sp.]RWK27234.1 MAG: transporter substrate-binding domain-containing protein [Mesorhizobium sp.]RWM20250.1 MAG: transporter substrate-binding domain-containing protein [Mesorhizobium sp.]